VGQAPLEALQPGQTDQLGDARPVGLRIPASHLELQRDVADDTAPGQEGGLLEHEAHLRMRVLHKGAVDSDVPLGRAEQARHQPPEGALPAPRGPNDREELCRGDAEVDARQSLDDPGQTLKPVADPLD
jgi:hypothetical protein